MLKTYSGRNSSQNEFELRSFISFLRERSVVNYLEIGARHGDTFHEVMMSLPIGSNGIAIDLPGGLWGAEKSRPFLQRAVSDLRKNGYFASCHFADSHDDSTRDMVAEQAPFDAILIDGDHTLEGVTRDWELYSGMSKIIAFHDIVGEGQSEKVYGNSVEVPKLWAELKAGFNSIEFIDSGSKMGIGCILI